MTVTRLPQQTRANWRPQSAKQAENDVDSRWCLRIGPALICHECDDVFSVRRHIGNATAVAERIHRRLHVEDRFGRAELEAAALLENIHGMEAASTRPGEKQETPAVG